jgi:hypothetical protein
MITQCWGALCSEHSFHNHDKLEPNLQTEQFLLLFPIEQQIGQETPEIIANHSN